MMETRVLVDEAIALDREIKEKKRALDGLKAKLQSEALTVMENRNLRYQQFFGEKGYCNVAYKEKLEVDSLAKLEELCGDLVAGKVKATTEVKYEVEDAFKRALIALYKGDWREVNLVDLLSGLGLDAGQMKVALKKLKGDYLKDKAVLASFGVTGDLEEELDAIHDQKNYELIGRFFDISAIDTDFVKKLRLAVNVEETLALGLTGGVADE